MSPSLEWRIRQTVVPQLHALSQGAGELCRSLNELRAETKVTLERFICNYPVKLSRGRGLFS